MVMVLGPTHPFQALETQALRSYLESGGSILVALEPRPARAPLPPGFVDPLEKFVQEVMGLRIEDGILADERNHLPLYNNAQDRFLIVTDSYSSHGSSRTVAGQRPPLLAPLATHLEETENHESSVTVTVRTRATTWSDIDGNAEFSSEQGESKTTRNLVAAVTGGVGEVSWRAVVTSDASMFSDIGLGNSTRPAIAGNVLLMEDVTNWLIGAEDFAGTTESEEDVRIDHTKGTQKWWFYLTVLLVPLGVFVAGAARVRIRQRGQLRVGKGGRK